MSSRTLPLFDPSVHPSSWNERMVPGEYAVHYSTSDHNGPGAVCDILPSLSAAEAHAAAHVQLHPNQRCRIYDHNGFIGAPIRELRGASYRGERDLSTRFRRWTGSILFFGGLALTLYDWSTNFRIYWAALIGTLIILPGLFLLVVEAVLIFQATREPKPHT